MIYDFEAPLSFAYWAIYLLKYFSFTATTTARLALKFLQPLSTAKLCHLLRLAKLYSVCIFKAVVV